MGSPRGASARVTGAHGWEEPEELDERRKTSDERRDKESFLREPQKERARERRGSPRGGRARWEGRRWILIQIV